MKNDLNISRRSLVQHIALATVAMGLSPLTSFKEPHDKISTNELLPFYLPPPPLQPGPGGIDIRTWVRSSKTNQQFSCVETAVAARHNGFSYRKRRSNRS